MIDAVQLAPPPPPPLRSHSLSVGKPDPSFCRTGEFNLTLHGHCLRNSPLSNDHARLPSPSPYTFRLHEHTAELCTPALGRALR